MILVFKAKDQTWRFDSDKPPDMGSNVRIDGKEFRVTKVTYEYFGKNNQHIAEVELS